MKCVACHVVSRDGKYLVAPVDATSGKSLWVTEVTKDAPPKPLVKSIANTDGHGFATISPDDATVIAAFGGKMWTVDRATGSLRREPEPRRRSRAPIPTGLPTGNRSCSRPGMATRPAGASLALLPFQNGQWGAPTKIVDPPIVGTKPMGTNLFPMHSPGRQVDRLHARREGRPRRPDLPAVDGRPPPAGRPSSW